MNNYVIAIDGPVASGKGTVARMLSRKLGIICLDTGALYRGIAVYFIDNKIDETNVDARNKALGEIQLDVKCVEGVTVVLLNGVDVNKRIRDNVVSVRVPQIAKLPEVREKVRIIQQQIAGATSLVCEGRDITSVVFPYARFKFYLTACAKMRAQRRFDELTAKGEDVSLHELEQQIRDRDHADMTRETSPLICVPDAIKIDATHITAYEVAKKMEQIITQDLQKERK